MKEFECASIRELALAYIRKHLRVVYETSTYFAADYQRLDRKIVPVLNVLLEKHGEQPITREDWCESYILEELDDTICEECYFRESEGHSETCKNKPKD